MHSTVVGLLLGILSFAMSAASCAVARLLLLRRMILDTPNSRSSHAHPVPRGGGVGFITVILVVWTILWLRGDGGTNVAVLVGASAVAFVSFFDDLWSLSASLRLAAQAAAVFGVLLSVPSDLRFVSDALPLFADRLVAGLSWLWFVNLFNFMDGIDGLAAGEAVVVAAGVLILAVFRPSLGLPVPQAIVVTMAVLAFLPFNWSPARMFMGDVGSIGLGFLLGWLLLATSAAGATVPAIILPLYFVVDATATLAHRALRGKPLGRAHREHAYQVGTDKGIGQARVAASILTLGVVLAGLAVLSLFLPVVALTASLVLVASLMLWLRM